MIDWTMSRSLDLPDNLPRPVDDGATDHLPGLQMPSLELPATDGRLINLAASPGRTVLFCYPKTGRPDRPVPADWDDIPGARGCTPQTCSFRDSYQSLLKAGAKQIFGLSTQDTAYQREAVERLHLPYPLLSDKGLDLIQALRLPTFEFAGETLVERLALIIDSGRITKVFYPVFPPDQSANEVLHWLGQHPAKAA
jgi:peroxiredoxin